MLNISTLNNLPVGLRDPLIKCYQEIVTNYSEHRWEPSELNGGKFCEIVYTIIEGYINGTFPLSPSKPLNMVAACLALEKIPSNPALVGDRSVRIHIPRVLPFLYEIRNNRGVGHIGGDVVPNFMDASAVVNITSWILAELVRIFHNVPIVEAQELVDALVERKLPAVWKVGDMRRVLISNLRISEQVLLLLHTNSGWVGETDLFKWVEYSTLPRFRQRILSVLHKSRLIEYNRSAGLIRISPSGVAKVEQKIIKSII